jgi:formylglycine-generating enzyme required for sulfatase activity
MVCCGVVLGCGSTAHLPGKASGGTGQSGSSAGESVTTGTSAGGDGSAGSPATGGAAEGGAAGSPASSGMGAGEGGDAPVGGQSSIGCTAPLEEQLGELCVAKLVTVDGGYSIDATEVTRLQYFSWLETEPPWPAADSACGAQQGYEPDAACLEGKQLSDPEHQPMTCVDWCDAAAYCQGVGKRLCGKIGGGANGIDDVADATKSQWYRACSAGGVNTYPYGGEHDGAKCNDYDHPRNAAVTLPVGSLTGCQSSVSGFGGVFDLSGNVHEWEDSCETYDFGLTCHLRGGAVVGASACADGGVQTAKTKRDDIGFRCCKD